MDKEKLLHRWAKMFPLREGRQRPRLDSAHDALEQSQELVPKRVVVEAAVGFMNEAGLSHGRV
jgi:hypothetical protein